jgi:hypothetical protein
MDDQIRAGKEHRRQQKELRVKLHGSAQKERAKRHEKALLNRARSRDRDLIHKTFIEARDEVAAQKLNFVLDQSEYDFGTFAVGLAEMMEMRLDNDDSVQAPSYLEPQIRRAHSGQVARAITDYSKQARGQLSVTVDELVIVLDDRGDVWHIRNAAGLEGKVPRGVFELDGPSGEDSTAAFAGGNSGSENDGSADSSSDNDDGGSGSESEPEEQAAAEKLRLLAETIGSFLESSGSLRTAAVDLSSTLALNM